MTKKYKVLITWRLLVENISVYKSIFKKNKINYDLYRSTQHVLEADLLKIIHKYDGIICGDDEITKKVIDKAKKLQVISKWGTGIDSIDKNYAKEKNISIYNTPGAFTTSVAQHGVALMFAILRNIVFNHIDILEKNWSKRTCYTVESKKIGII
jgi:D-3-phosphoglycerate dehydrogenase